ncbi:hypothetical protein [Roseateles terrae]|uniref:Uncharacterized protein n=1 Tax=Roseateles terrae TaxID=431060 RepID=A0ABR6GPN6_9BURK|nr:hypothetical protein [Roseateles terrae]MBB3194089.1 hypothetical protein [Roseateles terrae]OWQ87952.1 hypothetical protein CDN98_07310 [Roseateles terrae]
MDHHEFRHASLLGAYDNHDEYQLGTTLIWVDFENIAQRHAATEFAHQEFPAVWAAIPAAIAEARRILRSQAPEFWRSHEEAGTSEELLAVWGIRINPTARNATYHVSTNYDFESPYEEQLPSFPDDVCVFVQRGHDGVIGPRS